MASLISLGQVLDHGLEQARQHAKDLVTITLWMLVAAIPSVVGKLLAPTGGDETLVAADWVTLVLGLGGTILLAVVSVWMSATLTLAAADQANGKRTKLAQWYKLGWKAFLPYVLLTIMLLAIVIGVAGLIIPGIVLLMLGSADSASPILTGFGTALFLVGCVAAIYLLVKLTIQLAYAPFVLVLEKVSPITAIKTSYKLVEGRWWSTFIRFIVPKVLYLIALFVITFVVFNALKIAIVLLADFSNVLVLALYTAGLFLAVWLSAIVTPLSIVTDYHVYDSLRKTR